MSSRRPAEMLAPGPFKVDALPSKTNYELDNGHPVLCLPTKARGGRAQNRGAMVIASDPAVQDVGVEIGYKLGEGTMRAPDVSVPPAGAGDGWVEGAPALALEYADDGQDEAELRRKVGQLLDAGTRAIWVVRLGKIQRVEVHTPDAPVSVHHAGDDLVLPGVLQNPVPVAALFDDAQAERLTLRNLLERFGYDHPERAREEGRLAGFQEGIEKGRLAALREAATLVLRARGEGAPEPTLDEAALLALISRA